jgi:hypothetical protein
MDRPEFFGRQMPNKPDNDLLINKYHQCHKAYDQSGENRHNVVEIGTDSYKTTDGKTISLNK